MDIWEYLRNQEWALCKRLRRRRLRTTDFTIIASTCTGAIMYHDLGLPYRTPTVNLTISMRDLVKMAGDLRWYMDQELVECAPLEGERCPTALLGDIRVNFVHYNSFAEAAEKWNARKKRICWDRLVLVGSEREDCDYEVLQAFDRLPWPNKVVLTHVDYPEFPSAFHIPGFEDQPELGMVLAYKPQPLKRRYMDGFDYVTFLNQSVRTDPEGGRADEAGAL